MSLAPSVLRLSAAVRILLKESAEAVGLTPAQAQALRFVARTKTFMASVGNLAATLGTTHVTAVKIVGVLERRGLLERAPGERDRRVTLLRLTPEGQGLVERLDSLETALDRSLSCISAPERRALGPLLDTMVRSLAGAGAVPLARPCPGCSHFSPDACPESPEPHRCELLGLSLSQEEALRDCPDHATAA